MADDDTKAELVPLLVFPVPAENRSVSFYSGGIKDEDRKHIISLVFRPTSDGLVRDDAAPPGWLNWLTRSGR